MTRRVVHAVLALAMFAIGSLAWAQPAHAEPGKLCSTEEWRNPAMFSDCAKRTQEAVSDSSGCVTSPTPGNPTSGMAGWFTSRPESSKRDGVGGQYSAYGVGGYGIDTYDIGCLGTLKHPDLVAWNTVASAQFSAAASIMGAANGLRENAYDPGSMWGWSNDYVKSATEAIYTYIFTPFGAIMLAVLGAFLIWRARQGEMSMALRLTAWAILVLVAATAVAKWPVASANGADTGAKAGLTVVHSVLGPGRQDVPADKCALGPSACVDNRSVATRASDVAVEAVLYRPWLRAVLGSADSETAKAYGPALYDATTMRWDEAERHAQNATLRKQLIDQKAATFRAVAEQIRANDPLAYEYLQGVHGADRAGAGTVALISALGFAAFDIAASLVILFAFLIFRIAIIALPLLGTVGVFMPASAGLRRIFHMTVAAFVNIVVFGAGAGMYLTAVDLIFRSSLPGAAQMFAVLLTGAACFFILRPVRHLIHTATGRARTGQTFGSRLIKAGKDITSSRKNQSDADQTSPTVVAGAATGSSSPRPETTTARPFRRNARTIVAAVAPSTTTATSNPYVVAVTEAVNTDRPETARSKTAKARAATGAVLAVATVDAQRVGSAPAAPSTETRS